MKKKSSLVGVDDIFMIEIFCLFKIIILILQTSINNMYNTFQDEY